MSVLKQVGLNTIEVLLWARGKSLKEVRKRLRYIQEGLKRGYKKEVIMQLEVEDLDSESSEYSEVLSVIDIC